MNLLCIDPGLLGVGAALWKPDRTLSVASYVKNPVTTGRGYAAHAALAQQVYREYSCNKYLSKIIIEHPVIYPGQASRANGENPDDLLDVVAVGAAIASYFSDNYGTNEYSGRNSIEIVTVKPSEWKGNMPKEKMTERIRAKAEARGDLPRIVGTKSLMHNVLDAYGIGLWYFDLLNVKVYPGATP